MANAFLFIGLFIIVGGVIKVGLISNLSEGMISLTKPSAENMFVTAITTLWFSAISSAIVDNIPFVASMIPLVIDTAHAVLPSGTDFKSVVQHPTLMPVWWSLALGACLGGNGSPVGRICQRYYLRSGGKGRVPYIVQKIYCLRNTHHHRDDYHIYYIHLVTILRLYLKC